MLGKRRRTMSRDGYENRLKFLKLTHRELDNKILKLEKNGYDDAVRAMKVRKLRLKDQIARLKREQEGNN